MKFLEALVFYHFQDFKTVSYLINNASIKIHTILKNEFVCHAISQPSLKQGVQTI